MDAAAFWKFVGKNVGILPFIKKKVEGFSFVFTVYSGLRICFSPIWNLTPGSFPQTAGEKNPVWKTDTNGGFPHCFCTRRRGGRITPSVIACGDATLPLLSLRDIFPRRRGSLSSKGEPLAEPHTLRGLPRPLPLGEVALRSKDGEGEDAYKFCLLKNSSTSSGLAAQLP